MGWGRAVSDGATPHEDLRTALAADFTRTRAELERLVRIPSVSAAGFDSAALRASADAVAELMRQSGLENVRLLEITGAHPAVLGERPGPAAAPTVLLYAHHDVQPPGDAAQWTSDPFAPHERDGRLYGRGACDDKAGIVAHLAALRALGASLPVRAKLFVEGEEEVGSPHLPDFLARYREALAADVIVIADAANWRLGEPALTTTLRGLIDCEVEVRTLEQGVHSGLFGGVFPDALMALARVLASLHDAAGRPAVPGLVSHPHAGPRLDEAEVRAQAGAPGATALIGHGPLTSRLWSQPAISVLAVDAPRVAESINQLVPVARAKVSLRLAPGDDPQRAMTALTTHMQSQAPWGARVTVRPGAAAEPVALDTSAAAYDAFRAALAAAWGRPPVAIGLGGSIPFVAAFQRAYPAAAILLTAVGEPASRIHGPNESQDLDELRRACLAEAIALRALGA